MSQTLEEKIVCPNCNCEQSVTIYRSVNAAQDEEERAKIMMNTLFTTTCKECGEKIPLLYNCLYHDTEGEAMYWLLPSMSEEELAEMNNLLQQVGESHNDIAHRNTYRYRKVLTTNELREKILISSQNLDDRIIELLKVVYLIQLSEQIGDKVVSEILFDVIDDVYYIEIFYEDMKLDPGVIIPDMRIYKQLQEEFWETITEKTPQGFAQIDFQWAKNVLFQK